MPKINLLNLFSEMLSEEEIEEDKFSAVILSYLIDFIKEFENGILL